MTARNLNVVLLQVSNTAEEWSSLNPVLKKGQIGYETDTFKVKIGNGTDEWNDLSYIISDNKSLTISLNGTSQGSYDGSSDKSINITATSVGAAPISHTHSQYLPIAGGTVTGNLTVNGSITGTASNATNLNNQPASYYLNYNNLTNKPSIPSPVTVDDELNSESENPVQNKVIKTALDGKANTSGTYAGITAGTAQKTTGALTVSLNGTSQGSYNGSANKSINITASSVGAAPVSHTHNYAGSSSAGGAANSVANALTFTGSSTGTYDGSEELTINIPAAYTHPTATARSAGLYKITVNNLGHVTGATAVTKSDITALGIPASDTNTTYSAFKGATSEADGTSGLVVAPTKGASNRYLRSDGTWAVPPDTNTTYTLSSFGITATAKELNYTDGVTSNIQTQLNGKASSSHTHNYAGSSSAGGAANSVAGALTISLNGTSQGAYDGSDDKSINITASSVGAAPTSHSHSVASTSAAGFLRQLNGSTSNYLRGDGTWATPPNTTYSNFSGASSSAAGKAGLVPAPSAGSATRYLRSDGTWTVPPDTNTTYSAFKGATTSAAGSAGLVIAPSAGAANRYLRSDGTWSVPPDTNTTYSLSSFGITATAAELNKLDGCTATVTELNYLDGVTSAIQTQLNGKAASSHTHNYAGSSSAGGAAKSVAGALTISLNGTSQGAYNGSAAKSVNITASSVGAAAASHTHSYAAASHTHPVSQVTGLTASRALVSDSSGHPAVSAVTSTELSYLDGVTSAIQTQLNGKAASSHGTHVSYGTSCTALTTSTSGTAGSATTVSRSDHRHGLPSAVLTTADTLILVGTI